MDTLKRVLMFEEGYRGEPYLCPAGAETIGYGHNLSANPLTDNDCAALGIDMDKPLNLTKAQAEALLCRDLDNLIVPAAYRIFNADNWTAFGGVRRAALGSMIYQLGETGFAGFRGLVSHVLRHDWTGAADAALDSKWARVDSPARAKRHAKALWSNLDVWREIR